MSEQPPPLDWNGPTDRPFRQMTSDYLERPVDSVFAEVLAKHGPSRPAVRDHTGTITYGALAEQVRAVGAALGGVEGEQPLVGIALPVDHRFVAAMLGALAAGWAYVPLDLSQPAERLGHIAQHAGVRCVLACAETIDAARALVPPSCEVVDVDLLPAAPSGWSPSGRPDDIAYVLYTSGSTGSPKGVFQAQRGLMHDVAQYTNSVHFSELDVTSLLYSPGVNGALRDIYGALLNGGCLCMVDLRRDGYSAAAARLAASGITIFHAMPPVLRSMLREVRDRSMMERVRLAYVAGDRFWGSDVRLLREALPEGAHLYTGIGSTECATLFRQWFVPADWPVGDGLIPVGHAVPDRELLLVDVDEGGAGVITVRGRHLARGYWRDPEQTAAAFAPDPADAGLVTLTMGDRGRLRPDGLLEFLGRADRQVKIRGHRVELAEVETVMRGAAGVVDAAVVSEGEGDACRLVAFAELDGSVDVDSVVGALDSALPGYMRPAQVVHMEALPRLGNGKLDMRALADAASASPPSSSPVVPEGDEVLALVVAQWGRVVGSPPASAESRWDRSGGDSLLALELVVALEGALGVGLPADLLAAESTPTTVASRVREAVEHGGFSPMSTDAPLGTLFIVPWAPGASIHERALADLLRPHLRVEVLNLPTLEDELVRVHSIPDLARRCANEVERLVPAGTPICLLGMSFGARVAVEAACMLLARGHVVALLGVGDVPSDRGYEERSRRLRAEWVAGAATAAPWARGSRQLAAWARAGTSWCVRGMARHGWQVPLRLTAWAGLTMFGQSFRAGALTAIRQSQVPSWTVPSYPGELVLFLTDETARAHPEAGPCLGWEQHARSVRVVRVDGDHMNYFGPEHGPRFALQVLALARAAVGG